MQIASNASSPESTPSAASFVLPAGAGGAPQRPVIELDLNFDPMLEENWCQLVREVVAVANSGGGKLRLRRRAGGSRVGAELTAADVMDRVLAFTEPRTSTLPLRVQRDLGHSVDVVSVGAAELPIVFTRGCSYADPADAARRVEVFAAGSVYFRHADGSGPGTSADFQECFERLLRRVRRQWLRSIRRQVDAPLESLLRPAIAPAAAQSGLEEPASLRPVRIVTDPEAPVLQPQDVDRLYPWRQKDLVRELNRRLGRRVLNGYDIQAVRRQHALDERPDFVFHLFGAARRYSPAMADWVMAEYAKDPEFFRRARAADRDMLRLRRRKPR